jgi:hypothetical protein
MTLVAYVHVRAVSTNERYFYLLRGNINVVSWHVQRSHRKRNE